MIEETNLKNSAGLYNQINDVPIFKNEDFTIDMLEKFMGQLPPIQYEVNYLISGAEIKEYLPEIFTGDIELDRNYLIRF